MVSRVVKEGLELRVDVKVIFKFCDSFCLWDIGFVERRIEVR